MRNPLGRAAAARDMLGQVMVPTVLHWLKRLSYRSTVGSASVPLLCHISGR